jgi:hypothetical protein
MKLVKLDLISKNNKKNGFYLYVPIVEKNGEFFWCESVKTNKPIKTLNQCELKINRKIPSQALKANGL